jgi:hypothetical protein
VIALGAVAIAGSMIFSCSTGNRINQNLSQTCYRGHCLAYTTWGQNIDAAIDQQAVGYAYIILNNGLLVESNAYGKARTASDPPETAMTLDARSNAASVTNFALFRILIPYLNGFNDAGVQDLATATDKGYLTYMSDVYSPDIPISCAPGPNPVLS